MADGTARDLTGLLESIGGRDGRLVHLQRTPARPGRHADWPDWADPDLVAAYRRLGVERPWTHQVAAAHSAHAGRHTVLATGTGSGKSLAAWLPALSDVLAAQSPGADSRISAHTRRPTTLYLSPTKALAADQAAALARLIGELEAVQREAGTPAGSLRTVRAGTCDGDTPLPERDWVRAHADVVLTNPDFLHFSLLPGHERWSRLLRGLRYIVIDECHAYRGILGAHVALVLRRLLRLVARLRPRGPQPVVLCASATTAEPALTAARLIGVEPDDVVAVTEDGAPAGERTLALWQPALRDPWALPAPGNGSPTPEDSPSPDAPRPTRADDDSLPAPNVTPPPQHVSGTEAPPKASPAAVASAAHGRPPVTSGATPPGSAEPDSGDPGEDPSARRSAVVEAAELLVDLLSVGARALVFVRSRRSAEVVAERARHTLGLSLPELVGTVSAYRGGYLPEERRALEADLRSGRLRALATTNALELGIDVTGLDAVLIAGWPGTRVSLGQQAGRAGRAGTRGLAVLIASDNPLDAYLVHHPEAVFAAPEATVFDPANPYVLAPHLCAAASEAPLRTSDLALFGLSDDALLRELEGRGALRRRPTGWFWNVNLPGRPQDLTSLRGDGPPEVPVVEADTGVVIGTVDGAAADSTVHEGAVYVHQGRVYVVEELADDVALVRQKAAVGYRTRARSRSSVRIIAEREQQVWGRPGQTTPGDSREPSAREPEEPAGPGGGPSGSSIPASTDPNPAGSGRAGVGPASSAPGDAPESPTTPAITWSFGSVEVTSQVTGYQRMALPGGEVVSQHALEMDEHVLPTAAVWWTIPQEVCEAAGLEPTDLPGALHAAEHASIGMLPLLATCDRWDIGGLSTAMHPQTGAPTVFVHDGHAGGAGFAERGYRAGRDWLEATLAVIEGCGCASGCPSCVQSPKCGNNNEPLDKAGAVVLLRLLIDVAPHNPSTTDPAHRDLSGADDVDAASTPVTRGN